MIERTGLRPRASKQRLRHAPHNRSFTAHFSKIFIEQTAGAAVNSAIAGASLEESLQAAVINSLITSSTAQGANAIGDLGLLQNLSGEPVLNPAGKALLHALVGCAGGAVQAGTGGSSVGCAAGAGGAVIGELAAAWYDPTGSKPRADTEAFAAAVAGLGGVLAGDESGAGVNIAAQAGRNAAANNYLNHVRPGMLHLSEVEQYERAASECGAGDASACARRDALADTSRKRDRELQQACSGATPMLCNSLSAQASAMGNTVRGQSGGLVYANSPNGGVALNVATVGAPVRVGNFHDQAAGNLAQALPFAGTVGSSAALVGAGVGSKVVGGAVLGAGFDAAGQLYQTGEIRIGQTLIAASTGAVAGAMAGTSILGNALIGGAVGGVNTFYSNVLYQEEAGVPRAIGLGAAFGAGGTAIDATVTSVVCVASPGFVGGTKIDAKIPILFQNYGRPNPWPGLVGNTIGHGVTNTPSFISPKLPDENR